MIIILSSHRDLDYLKWFLNTYRIEHKITPHISVEGLREWIIYMNQEIPDIRNDLEAESRVYQLVR